MVGMPGRSKGCNTCRKRKVKCDETRPFCQRCVKGGFECRGYVRPTQWIHSSTAPFTDQADVNKTEIILTVGLNGETPRDSSPVTQPPSPVPKQLSLVAFEGDFCFAYTFSNFVWRGYGSQWLDQAAEGRLGDLALDSVKALSYSTFGKSNSLVDLELKGSMHYGRCLRMLAKELRDGTSVSDRNKGELLVPILVLMMHASTLTDRVAVIFHISAVAKLLQMCGPEAFQRQPLLNALEATRATLVVASLISRQKVFLEDHRWRDVPWALDPMAKSQQNYLLDILSTVPGILEDHAKLAVLAPNEDRDDRPTENSLLGSLPSKVITVPVDPLDFIDIKSLRNTLLGRIKTQLETLYRWRWRWQAQHGHTITTSKSTPQPNTPLTRTLGSIGASRQLTRLSFTRPDSAADVMLYNATLMWLLALLWDLEPLAADTIIDNIAARARDAVISTTSFSSTTNAKVTNFAPLRRPGASVTVRDPAMEICAAFEWQSRHHGSGREANFLYMFPVGMALSVLDAEPDVMAWVRGLLDSHPLTRGYGSQGGGHVGMAKEGDGKGGMEGVSRFGTYLTKEIEAAKPETEEDDESVHEGESGEGKVFNPGLVHMLLLRGRMAAS